MDDRVHPTRSDDAVAAASAVVGGPLGSRAGRHPWWTPVRVVLAIAAITFALGMVQKSSCYEDTWSDGEQRYTHMCYSDLPFLYTGRGFVELAWPYDDDPQVRGRYEVMEYPVGISYWAYATARVTHWVTGAPDAETRYARPTSDFWGDSTVQREIRWFVIVNAIGFAVAVLLAAWFLARVDRRRPWDAMLFAASPALLLTGLINWDLLAVTLVAAAIWAWARDRPVLTGVLIGLGTATKLYPLFLLGAVLVICVCDKRVRDFVLATAGAAVAWVLANAPAYLQAPEAWKVFWSFNSDRGADLGSVWLVISQATDGVDVDTVNLWSWLFFGAWCVGVFVVGILAPETPRFAQLGFLIVAGFLFVNKVYSPQYVLWLLPLAVIAHPRWRAQLAWQATEVAYFASVWWYLNGDLAPAGGDDAGFYWVAILLRIAGELFLVGLVVRGILWPHTDPVRADARAQLTTTRSKAVAV